MSTSHTVSESPYKYSLKSKLYALTEKRRAEIKEQIMQAYDLSPRSYSRYINLQKDASQDVPAAVLKEFALLLNVPITDLFN